MGHGINNRFQDFFRERSYVVLKNHLYNYLLRKRAVRKNVNPYRRGVLLEVGSGISPMISGCDGVVFSDLSFDALDILRKTNPSAMHVVADGMNLPFRNGTFPVAICSEVLEHIEKDGEAVKELARVIQDGGTLVTTFPHRERYFALDDRFVGHHRRYELSAMIDMLKKAGLWTVHVEKVLGPMEKITMWTVVLCYSAIEKRLHTQPVPAKAGGGMVPLLVPFFKLLNIIYMGLAWLDARVMPRSLSSVLLIRAVKDGD